VSTANGAAIDPSSSGVFRAAIALLCLDRAVIAGAMSIEPATFDQYARGESTVPRELSGVLIGMLKEHNANLLLAAGVLEASLRNEHREAALVEELRKAAETEYHPNASQN
jgi:hypothetical protein